MKISALNESGQPVDWWFIYKIPKLTQDSDSDSATGYEYAYFDANAPAVGKSPYRLDQGKGALNLTLEAVFKNPDPTTGWVLYNDEKPVIVKGADNGSCGHTKGVIAFDTATGTAFWLLHSWPKYAAPGLPHMPTPEYGQTYLCLTISLETANAIAAQMANHQEPQTFMPRPANLKPTDPLHALTEPLNPKPPADADILEAKTAGGMPFKVLAKNREWNQDFWNGFVGPKLGSDMDVETWIRGSIPPVADTDGIHKTFDIKYINLGPLGLHYAWPESKDHAKWGITKDNDWICVGDINRMISQRKRGGGTIAFQNRTLWTALAKTDLLLAPPGHTRDEARTLIQSTHKRPAHEEPIPDEAAAPEKMNHKAQAAPKTKTPVKAKKPRN